MTVPEEHETTGEIGEIMASGETQAPGDPGQDRPPTGWQRLAPLIDLVTPMAMRVAATLRLADELGEDPVPVDSLATAVGAHPDALGRLLRHLAAHGVFAEPTPGEFTLTEPAALLRSDHPSGMQVSLDLGGFGGQMDLAFTGLLHTVRTGHPAWDRVFGAPFWESLERNPPLGASFDAAMSAGQEYLDDDVAAADWTGCRHLVDVGGGTGALVAAVLTAHPALRATLVDLPETADRARRALAEQGLADRAVTVGQSFFDPLPRGGDLYLLNSILHDWPDDAAVRILGRCAEAAGRQGRVMVIEEHGLDRDGRDGGSHAEMDLRMLVLCGGRDRTVPEFTGLIHRAGLTVTEVRSTPRGQTVIDCVGD